MVDPVKNKFAERSERTREELLEAGARVLVNGPPTGAFAHVTAQRVANEAQRTTGAFFHQWPRTDDFLADLFWHVLDPSRSVAFDAVAETLRGGVDGGSRRLVDLVLEASDVALDTVRHDPQTLAEVLMWTQALRNHSFTGVLGDMYSRLDATGGQFFEDMLEAFGYEIRPPFSSGLLASVFTAVTQGISVRHELTPGYYPEHLLGMIILALLPLFATRPGDDRSGLDWLRQQFDETE